MPIFFLIVLLFLIFFTFISLIEINKKVLTPLEKTSPPSNKIYLNIGELYSFYSHKIMMFLPFFLVFLILVYFVDKNFFLPFLYGIAISLLFVFFDNLLNFYLSLHLYPLIISGQERERINNILNSSKGFLFLSFNYLFYFLFLRFSDRIDYTVIFAGVSMTSLLVYISSVKNKKISFFLNNSFLSALSLFSILIFIKYFNLNNFKIIIILFSLYYLFKILNSIFKDNILRLIKFENLSKNLLFFILYALSSLIIFYINKINLFLFLFHIIFFIIIYIIIRIDLSGFYKILIVSFLILSFKISSSIINKYAIGLSEHQILLFIIALNTVILYDYLKENETKYIYEFNKKLMSEEPVFVSNINCLKIPFCFILFSFYSIFIYLSYLMSYYYGYVDNFDIIIFLISSLVFYFFESFSDELTDKIENSFLNSLYNISVLVFVFSFVIVSVSYSTKISFTNLYGTYLLFSFLVLLFSKKYYLYIISVFYLSMFYIMSYVRG